MIDPTPLAYWALMALLFVGLMWLRKRATR